jgi:hypothetical protein
MLEPFECQKAQELSSRADWHVTCILVCVIKTDGYVNAVRVDGEVLLLHCWACGTEHCMNVEQCTSEELHHLICSKCGTGMFLVDELTEKDQSKQLWINELSSIFAALSWFRI